MNTNTAEFTLIDEILLTTVMNPEIYRVLISLIVQRHNNMVRHAAVVQHNAPSVLRSTNSSKEYFKTTANYVSITVSTGFSLSCCR